VKRPAFDLGLWALCTAVPSAAFVGAIALGIAYSGWRAEYPFLLVVAALGSLFLGSGTHDALRRSGYRVSRPRPDQAADYEDKP